MAESIKLAQKQAAMAGGISSQLDQLDNRIGKLGLGMDKNALSILPLMDEIAIALAALRQQGAAISAAENQYENSCRALHTQAGTFLRAIGGASVLRAERQRKAPPPESWWWFLDAYVSQKRRAFWLRTATTLTIMIAVLVAFILVYQRFLAPGPEVIIPYRASQQATELVSAGKLDEALLELQKGLDVAPDRADLLIIQGVIYTLQGKDALAAAPFARAQFLLGGAEAFLVARAQTYVSCGKYDRTIADARAVLKLNPNSAQGYLMLGSGQELSNDLQEAYGSYNRASTLADEAGDTTLVANIRVRLGMLMQQMNSVISTPTK